MKKNVIFVLVDSVFSECMSTGRTKNSSTPFLDSLIKEGFYADNVYSYGPYTDAATIGLYCGNPTLENYGYYFGINTAPHNHFQLFKDAGYETIGLYYPYYLISSKTKKNIDHSIYTGGFKYESVWGGKLKDYAEKRKKEGLSDLDYKLINKCLMMVFDCWMSFYEDISNGESAVIVNSLKDKTSSGSGYSGLVKEYERYKENPKSYIEEILELGMNHPLAHVNEFDFGKEKDKLFLEEVYAKHSKDIKKISRTNKRYAIKNSPYKMRKGVSHGIALLKKHDKSELRYTANYGMLMFANEMMVNRSLKQKNWQEIASLNKQFETLLGILAERGNSEKPFYASIHCLEPHHNISYFSFDSFNNDLIDEEFDYFMPLLDGLGKSFSGNVIYQLSLMYVDLCFKRLCESLKKLGLYENTAIVFVADHGTSYTFNPLRNTVVNTFHKENYKVPAMIWSYKMDKNKQVKTKELYMSEDILPTLLDIVGINKGALPGLNMTDVDSGRPYVITEYMGPGVPDMINREVWMSIRSNNYVLAYKLLLSQEFSNQKPCLFYDLTKDPKELYSHKVEMNDEISKMILAIEKRFTEIKNRTTSFLSRVDEVII